MQLALDDQLIVQEMCIPEMRLAHTPPPSGGPVVVRAPAHFVASNASAMHALLLDAIARGDTRAVDVDCSDTHYIDSAAIGAVIAAHKEFARAGGEIRWSGVSDEIASLLELTRVDRLMFVRRRSVAA